MVNYKVEGRIVKTVRKIHNSLYIQYNRTLIRLSADFSAETCSSGGNAEYIWSDKRKKICNL